MIRLTQRFDEAARFPDFGAALKASASWIASGYGRGNGFSITPFTEKGGVFYAVSLFRLGDLEEDRPYGYLADDEWTICALTGGRDCAPGVPRHRGPFKASHCEICPKWNDAPTQHCRARLNGH